MNWLWAGLAGLGSGVMAAMGMGGGGVLIIYLTIFAGIQQTTAQGINLIFFIPIAAVALFIYWKKGLIVWKTAIPSALLGIVGAVIGSFLSSKIDSYILTKIFGVLLFIMGIKQFFTNYKKNSA